MNRKISTLIGFFLLCHILVFGQVVNDKCEFALDLGAITDYCSGVTEFSNQTATSSGVPLPFCWFGGSQNDMWFTFTPTAPAAYIQMLGSTLTNPSFVVYSGECNNLTELSCGSQESGKILEQTLNNLVIGETYYLRVDARNDNVGSYQLCIKSYIPTPSPESDCKDAVVLCDKSPFQIDNLDNVGDIDDELTGSCVDNGQNQEKASVWYVWTCDEPGSLTFTLSPNNPNSSEEDLDFVVYELPGGLTDCNNRVSIRCMLSGESGNLSAEQNAPCYGDTGLAFGETDTAEEAGCNDGSNNFVAPLDMEAGKSYGLIVNNFSSSGYGFSIEFGGTGTFLGPKADFEIEALDTLSCDKEIMFKNTSSSETDQIVDYSWTFGAGATPISANTIGPHTTSFESFGDKVASLTITSSRGCTVTKIKDFFVAPCCEDLPTLDVTADVVNVLCNGDSTGSIYGKGISGNPGYQFSLDGINFRKNPFFANLLKGDYLLRIVDEKGCRDSINLSIVEPDVIVVDAGPDITVDLGCSDMVNASVTSQNPIVEYIWSPQDSFLTCKDCLNPEILALGTTTYTLKAIDEFGCEGEDSMTFFVNDKKPVYVPNVFSPNGDGLNDYFNVFGGKAIKAIDELTVHDRWGNLVYKGAPQFNDQGDGWNGRYKGQLVNSGVFAWMAKVRFLDDKVQILSGTVTVLR